MTTSTYTRPPALLTVDGVRLSYGAVAALHGVSLTVGQGEMVALIGANGAGKTSTLRAISSMARVSGGRVTFSGADITQAKPHTLVRAGIAHAPEGRGIFLPMTVEENLRLGAFGRSDASGIARDIDEQLQLFPILKERFSQRAGTMSGGEQQMLSVARALMSKPKLLLLDEPSLGLAPQIIEKIFTILKAIHAKGTSILLVEQNAHLALGLCHYAYVLETGNVVMDGTGAALLASPDIRRAYLGE
jgi:branched-chain amino acid transport system ATP-binding protein